MTVEGWLNNLMVSKLRGFDWLAGVFYPLAVILMEAFWVYPWLVWLGGWPTFTEPRPVLSLGSVIIVLAVSLLVTRVFLRQKWPMRLIQGVIIGSGLVAILLVLGVEYNSGYGFLSGRWFAHVAQVLGVTLIRPHTIVLALPALLYLWWRGIILGNTTSYFRSIYQSFLLGMVALIVLIIIWQVSSGSGSFEAPGTSVGFHVMAFFFFGLMAVAICQFYQMRRTMPREEAALTSVGRWLPMMLGIIGSMVVVGFLVAGIFSTEFFADIEHGAGVVFSFFGKIFDYLLVPFNYIFDWLFRLLQIIINWLRSNQPFQPEGSGNMSAQQLPAVTPQPTPPIVTDVVRWLVIAVIAAAVIFILARAVSRFRARRRLEEIEEIHESLWSLSGLKDDLRELFNMLGNKFKRKPAAASPGYRYDDAPGRLDIREIYRRLQWEAARSGLARRRHETAHEYAGRLGQAVPEGSEPLTQITDLYTVVRYGEISAPEAQVDRANSFWGTLRGLLRRLRID